MSVHDAQVYHKIDSTDPYGLTVWAMGYGCHELPPLDEPAIQDKESQAVQERISSRPRSGPPRWIANLRRCRFDALDGHELADVSGQHQ